MTAVENVRVATCPTLVTNAGGDVYLRQGAYLGDDGQWVVFYGHVDKRVARAAWVALDASTWGLSVATDCLDEDGYDMDLISHVWAVEEIRPQYPDEPIIRWRWDDRTAVSESTEHAFPLTVCEADA